MDQSKIKKKLRMISESQVYKKESSKEDLNQTQTPTQKKTIQPPSFFEAKNNLQFDDQSKQKYGLQKIDNDLKNIQSDLQQTFTFGVDLTDFGMNINENPLYMTFCMPFNEQPCKKSDSTNYQLPQCYLKPPNTLKNDLVTKLSQETLFYIFYNQQIEKIQAMVAIELINRKWSYYGSKEIWANENNQYFDVRTWQLQDLSEIDINPKDKINLEQFQLITES